MSEFFEINPKHLALAEMSQSFQLVVPESAQKGRDDKYRWTDIAEIDAVDQGDNPDKKQRYYEISVRFTGEGGPENVGQTLSRRLYINTEVMRNEKRLRSKHRRGEDGQAAMTQGSLARIGQLLRATGLAETEDVSSLFTIDSPLVGKKVWVGIVQGESTKADRAGKIDTDITHFLPYDG